MWRLLYLFLVWMAASFSLLLVWNLAPPTDGLSKLTFPKDLDDLRQLADSLEKYRNEHFWYTVILFACVYIYKQTFAIPGSFFLNLLAGSLFGVWRGCVIVCTLNIIGAAFCFHLSALFARPLIDRYFSDRLYVLRRKLATERDRLLIFLLGARVFPFTPHWLLNICSPFLDVPLTTHIITVGLGLLPYNVLCIRAGFILSDVRSSSDVFDFYTMLELFILAFIFFFVAHISKHNHVVEYQQ